MTIAKLNLLLIVILMGCGGGANKRTVVTSDSNGALNGEDKGGGEVESLTEQEKLSMIEDHINDGYVFTGKSKNLIFKDIYNSNVTLSLDKSVSAGCTQFLKLVNISQVISYYNLNVLDDQNRDLANSRYTIIDYLEEVRTNAKHPDYIEVAERALSKVQNQISILNTKRTTCAQDTESDHEFLPGDDT